MLPSKGLKNILMEFLDHFLLQGFFLNNNNNKKKIAITTKIISQMTGLSSKYTYTLIHIFKKSGVFPLIFPNI